MNRYGVSRLASAGFRLPKANLFPDEDRASLLSTFWVVTSLRLVLLAILFQELIGLACGLIQSCLRFLLEQKNLVDGRIKGLDLDVADPRHRRGKVHVRELLGDLVLQLETLESRTLSRTIARRHLPG